MNFFKKIYCRAFQFCFHVALPFLPYREPEILDHMGKVAELFKNKKISRVLIVTDKGVSSLGLMDKLLFELTAKEISYFIYDETVPNPTISNIEAARKLYI